MSRHAVDDLRNTNLITKTESLVQNSFESRRATKRLGRDYKQNMVTLGFGQDIWVQQSCH
jgi:hypothetical protein